MFRIVGNASNVATDLDAGLLETLLGAVVMLLAEALKIGREKEGAFIAAMGFDVINDGGRRQVALLGTHGAPRIVLKLIFTETFPRLCRIEAHRFKASCSLILKALYHK
jgi:hypothetical protein